ncbi:MAG TPA: RNA-binding domain-containing protein [Pyrinomonadaceae bacterium]
MSESSSEQQPEESNSQEPINPKHRVSVDGDVSAAKLVHLINLQGEEDRLDYKVECSFTRKSKDKIEFVRDVVAMANTDGGYIVLGVREMTDGSLPRYMPEGLKPEDSGSLDISKLRQQVESFITERTNIQLQIHSLSEFDDNQFALIYIPPSQHKPIIFNQAGQYRDAATGKNETLFRSGDIVVRKGASTMIIDQSDMRRIVSEIRQREKSQWTEEILDIRALVQRLDRLIAILSGGAITNAQETFSTNVNSSDTYDESLFYLSPELMRNKTIELLEREKQISASRYIQNAPALFYGHIKDVPSIDENKSSEIKDNYLVPILDSLTAMGVVFIEYKQWELLASLQKSLYLLCRRAEKTPSDDQRGETAISKTWVWQEVIIRVYALGAVLVYREHWEQAKTLIKQEVDWEDYYRTTFWSRYFLIMVSRAQELKENGWVHPAINYIDSHTWIADLYMSDKDEITNAVVQFDFLQCVYLLTSPADTYAAEPYPSFAAFYQSRIEPVVLKLIQDGKLRETVKDISDERLASIILRIIKLTMHVPNSYIGWGNSWSDKRIQHYLTSNASEKDI